MLKDSSVLNPPLSIAVITCGRTHSLAESLLQLQGERFPGDQLVVIDDTPDGRVEPPVAVDELLRSGGVGAGGARNLGWATAAAPWVLFLDDDAIPSPGFLEGLRARIGSEPVDVVNGNVISDSGEVGVLFDARYPLSRGGEVAYYRGGTGTRWSPNDAWRTGVGACTAWRVATLREIGGFPETLGQGRPFGGAEDLAAFRKALVHGATICYDGNLVVRHRSPATRRELGRKMRAYARAEGALAAHVLRVERRLGMAAHLAFDLAGTARRLAEECWLVLRRRPALPLGAVASFPLDATHGFLGQWRLERTVP